MTPLINPKEIGMSNWIMVCIICSILESRGFSIRRACHFCKKHINDVHLILDFLFSSLNDNVFLHFDELDALTGVTDDDQERIDQFYVFWRNLLPYLKDKFFIFCTSRQAWFEHVENGRSSLQAPSLLVRIVLRALSKSNIKELISMSPAEDVILRSEGKTVLDQLNLHDENLLMAVCEQIERVTGGIPKLVDYSINYLCDHTKNQRISMEMIQELFDENSFVQSQLRKLAEVKNNVV
jgi:hypothetical protein